MGFAKKIAGLQGQIKKDDQFAYSIVCWFLLSIDPIKSSHGRSRKTALNGVDIKANKNVQYIAKFVFAIFH